MREYEKKRGVSKYLLTGLMIDLVLCFQFDFLFSFFILLFSLRFPLFSYFLFVGFFFLFLINSRLGWNLRIKFVERRKCKLRAIFYREAELGFAELLFPT